MAEKFSAEERAAMKEAAREAKLKLSRDESLADTLAKIDTMTDGDRKLALMVHEIAVAVHPDFEVRTWYGMPAYAIDGKVVLFYQDAAKFKVRYSTLGFQDQANLDEGLMWPTSYALTGDSKDVRARIKALIEQAVSGR